MVVTVISHAWKENWRSHQEKAFKRRLSYQHVVVWTLSVVCKEFQFLSTWLEAADDLIVGQKNDTGRNKCKTCNSVRHLKVSSLFLHYSDRDATCNNTSIFKVSTIPWLQTFTWKVCLRRPCDRVTYRTERLCQNFEVGSGSPINMVSEKDIFLTMGRTTALSSFWVVRPVALLIDLTTLYQLQRGLCLFIISTPYLHEGDGYWLTLVSVHFCFMVILESYVLGNRPEA